MIIPISTVDRFHEISSLHRIVASTTFTDWKKYIGLRCKLVFGVASSVMYFKCFFIGCSVCIYMCHHVSNYVWFIYIYNCDMLYTSRFRSLFRTICTSHDGSSSHDRSKGSYPLPQATSLAGKKVGMSTSQSWMGILSSCASQQIHKLS